ncbi:glycosyltransferase family 2 protein [Pedobacter foliorum]|uniref:glycosyltransferase family 2 protein n=1 Tax=Pedobacter foliorum TaxID=2739058 RepID=UPI001563399B|nr:glycosyltransferase family 2 protein [Pedobacter foliorum]NRF39179.1 glycosyltransferase family 2 protein [Pedobacter foliorum]
MPITNLPKSVAVILINWNSYEYTHNCIQSLYEMEFQDFDIILVDNGSKDGSDKKLIKDFPNIIFLKIIDNIGFTGSNNLALNYCINREYKYSMLLNNDTIVEPDFLKILYDYINSHPEVAAVQPKIYFEHDRNLLWNAGSYFNHWTGQSYTEGYNKRITPNSEKLKEVDWITGCGLLVRTELLKTSGLLDESLFMYYEDVDLSFRIKESGLKLMYVPDSIIYHIAGAAYKTKKKTKEGIVNPIVHYHNARNQIWMIKQYLNPLQKIIAYTCTFAYFGAVLVYFLLRWRIVKFKTYLKAVKDGIKGKMTRKYKFDPSV